ALVAIFLLAALARIYPITKMEYCANDCYSTHLKTSLNFIWSMDEFPNTQCSWYNREDLFNSFYKLSSDGMDLHRLNDELEASNHPPLYYGLIHIFQSMNQEGFPFYDGAYILNLCFSLLSIWVFFLILSHLFDKDYLVLLGTLWFALSFGVLQMVLRHKAYELQLLLSLILVLMVFRQYDRERLSVKDYISFGLVCL
ncbi:unnamed protein product, partial [Ectocarpus fasciculatus]